MARTKGTYNLSANIETNAAAPLDARDRVATKADLTAEGSFPYPWIGMETYITAENKKYRLIGADPTDISNWKELEKETDAGLPQYDTLPTPSADYVGKIVEYTGDTTEVAPIYKHGYFYECKEDSSVSPSEYYWDNVPVQDSTGGSSELGKSITAAIDVGGIDAGDTFAQGTSYDDMWDALLNPTLYPTFTAPSASLAYAADSYYAIGDTIAAKEATLGFDAGAITLNGTKQNNRAGAATGYALASSGADTEYSASSENSGAFSVSALTRSTKGAITLTGTVNYAAGPQPKDSKGGDYDSPLAAGSVTAVKTMNFIQPYYYGKSASSTIADFTGLTKDVKAKGNKTYKFTTNNEYMVVAYDSSYGNLTSILDGNGFETIGGWTKSSITVDGFTYFVYVSNSPTTDTNAAFTFKY